MKTGNNIRLRKRAKGIEKLYSKPASRFRITSKYFRRIRILNRTIDYEDRNDAS